LQRTFRRHTRLSIHDYVVRLRVLAALDRLVEGDGDLSTIACELGFSSHSHLSAAFRRILGQPPTVLRASLGREAELHAAGARLRRRMIDLASPMEGPGRTC
jgi:transcriptional regulator GlxA family with amidase domain